MPTVASSSLAQLCEAQDEFAVAAAYARVSSRARALDADFHQLMGASWPTRSFEALLTAVYQYELRAGWTLQPNFQYFVHPGGGATNPRGSNPGKLLKEAAVSACGPCSGSEVTTGS
jgi:porin